MFFGFFKKKISIFWLYIPSHPPLLKGGWGYISKEQLYAKRPLGIRTSQNADAF